MFNHVASDDEIRFGRLRSREVRNTPLSVWVALLQNRTGLCNVSPDSCAVMRILQQLES